MGSDVPAARSSIGDEPANPEGNMSGPAFSSRLIAAEGSVARILRAGCAEENSDWAHLMGSSGTLSLPKGAVDPVRLALRWQGVCLRTC